MHDRGAKICQNLARREYREMVGENQWQLEQLEELQLEQPDEPRELTDLPPLENPKREMLFLTRLLLHFSQGGNGELELDTIVSKVCLHFWHSNSYIGIEKQPPLP